ncbi:MAG: transcriptional repressor, partial [Acidobacteriota bacterium]
ARAEVPSLGLATVYRNLKSLVDDGTLATVELPGATGHYELAGKGHHHYFRCRSCDRVFDVEGCAAQLEELTPRGFQLEAHEIVLYGRCDACCTPS